MGDGGRFRAKQDRLDRARHEENARLNQAARGSLLKRLIGTPARINATGEQGVVKALNRATGEVTLEVAGEERTYRGVELTLEGLP